MSKKKVMRAKPTEPLYCCGGGYHCDKPARWIRHTQFSGDHPFCGTCARKEKGFGISDSYQDWEKIPKDQIAPPKPPVVKLSDFIATLEKQAEAFDKLASRKSDIGHGDKLVAREFSKKFHRIAAELKKVNAL